MKQSYCIQIHVHIIEHKARITCKRILFQLKNCYKFQTATMFRRLPGIGTRKFKIRYLRYIFSKTQAKLLLLQNLLLYSKGSYIHFIIPCSVATLPTYRLHRNFIFKLT